MQAAVRVGGLSIALSVGLLVASGPAVAARKPIGGRLSQPGYTVIALAANGKAASLGRAASVRATRGRFRLRPPARRVTLHLRAPNGQYAGPIVVGRRRGGRRAILGLRAGARLGRIAVRAGYARPARRVASRWVASRRAARARRGVPIGARVFGRVRSRPPRLAPPADRDFDGVPDPLDIDDDGDLILDDLDRSRTAGAAQLQGEFSVHSYIELGLAETVNANAAPTPLMPEDVEAALRRQGLLTLQFFPGEPAELDCGAPQKRRDPRLGGLVYCSRSGTGRVAQPGVPPTFDLPAFPGDPGGPFDSDGDGLGTLQGSPEQPTGMGLYHGASTAEIGSGDLLIERVTTGGVQSGEFSVLLESVFATVPALVSYDDGQGHSPTLAYPVGATTGLPVATGPNGDVIVTLTVWRPQRRPIGEGPDKEACLKLDPPCQWVDIGHLDYGLIPSGTNDGCPQSTLSENHDRLQPAATPTNFGATAGAFSDTADDQAASRANTLTYTVNLTQCLAARGLSFEPGELRGFAFGGTSRGGGAFQIVLFKRPGGRLIVRKQTDPAESPTSGTEFEFDPGDGIGGANFKLRHDGARSYDVVPGTYTVDELAAPGYELTLVGCSDSDSTGSTTDRRATFRIAADEHVTCTFTNKKL